MGNRKLAALRAALIRGIRDQSGADLIEYGLIVAIVALLAVAFLFAVKGGLSAVFTRTANCLNAAGASGGSPSSC